MIGQSFVFGGIAGAAGGPIDLPYLIVGGGAVGGGGGKGALEPLEQ